MSDFATIAMLTKDRGVKVSSVNNNGFIGWAGQVLVENYNDFAKAEKLIDLGDLQELGTTTDQCEAIRRYGQHYYRNEKFLALPKEEQERLEKDSGNSKYTVAYHRDLGDDYFIHSFAAVPAYLNWLKQNRGNTDYFLGSNDKHEPQWYVVDNTSFKPLFIDESNVHPEHCFLSNIHSYNVADYQFDFSTENMKEYQEKADKEKINNIEAYISELQQKYSLGSEKPSVTNIGFQYGGWGETVVAHLTQPNGKQYFGLHVPLYLIKDGKGFERQILKQLEDSLIKNAPKGIEDTSLYKILDKEYRDYVMRDTENILEQASRFAYVG